MVSQCRMWASCTHLVREKQRWQALERVAFSTMFVEIKDNLLDTLDNGGTEADDQIY